MAGNVTKRGITLDLEAMKAAGIGGAHIFDAGQGIPEGPIAYNSPQWRDLMTFAVKEADRLGLDMTMHNCSGWSSSGGPWVKPEDAMKRTTFRIEYFDGPGVPPAVPQPPTTGGYYQDIALMAVPYVEGAFNRDGQNALIGLGGSPRPDAELPWPVVPLQSVINQTGKSDTELGPGRWVIIRLGSTLTGTHNVASRPSGEGLEVDKFSAQSLDRFFAGGLDPLIAQFGPLAGKSFRTVLIDSYETGPQNWTPAMVAEFKKLRGYDPTPYLPALAGFAVESEETTRKFLFDFRRTLTDLWAINYSGHFAQKLAKKGIQLAVEPYGNGSFDPFTYGKPAGLVMGEYWVGEGAINGSVKQSSSVIHVYGKKVLGAESLTASPDQAGWRNQPRQWKPFADRGYINGVNRIIYHRFAHQPWGPEVVPGMTMGPWGSHVDRTETFWPYMKDWDRYLARCQYMLQAGTFYGDVLLFSGEGCPQEYVGQNQNVDTVPKGYDFDWIGSDPLKGVQVKNGLLVVPGGGSYRLLSLPSTKQLTLATARKIRDLVAAGAVVAGMRPESSPSLADGANGSAEVAEIGRKVWGDGDSGWHTYGKGKVLVNGNATGALKALGVAPDFMPSAKKVSTIHRRIDQRDAYFVTSFNSLPRTVTCTFRVPGGVPEFWEPKTGKIVKASVWRSTTGGVEVDIPFDANGSVFVVFDKAQQKVSHIAKVAVAGAKETSAPKAKIEILKAEYGALDRPNMVADVTATVAAFVSGGDTDVEASNDTMGGDPAFNVVKRLRVVYTVNGEQREQTVGENQTMALVEEHAPTQTAPVTLESNRVTVWNETPVSVKLSTGEERILRAKLPKPVDVQGAWSVSFPKGWDAPAQTTFEKLSSWTESAVFGIKYFSGTATYRKSFNVPQGFLASHRTIRLDLGDVRELARLKVNGQLVASFWEPPFAADVTKYVHEGKNSIEVEVTNLWVNRLIGDEQFPDDMGWEGDHLRAWPEWFLKGQPRPEPRRKTFTTWHHNRKDTPLMPSGLLGPVRLVAGQQFEVR